MCSSIVPQEQQQEAECTLGFDNRYYRASLRIITQEKVSIILKLSYDIAIISRLCKNFIKTPIGMIYDPAYISNAYK